ncbi:AraC family transcriptional regulator [Paenibacillus sp. CC-CFT747]|nr:AraC family transcriptional regulator [Paenibacillus sp. CC-CFT747]
MAKEKEGLANRLRSQAHAIRDQALLRLVQGKVKTPEEWEELKLYADLRLNKPHFAVLLLLIDDYKQFHSSNSDRMQEVLKYSLIKVFEELSSEAGTGFGMELLDGRGTVFLLNLNEGFGELEVVKELAMKAKEVYKQYFRFSVTVGIGGICQEYADIPALYVNATHAARQRFVKGNGCVIAYGEGTGRCGEWSLPVEGIDRLDKAIKQGDSREAEAAVADTFRHIVDRNVSLEAAECICFDIVNSLTRTLTELDVEIDESLGETLERLFVPRFETIEELEQMVTDICSNVCRYIAGQKESKNLVMLDRMKDYIAEHYADQTLNLDRIAGHFGLSSSYATRFFKDQTGTPLMKYIDEIRLSRTKQLLRTTDLPLKEVMAAAGYVDSTNYIRKFKKAEGVTPIQYRTIVRAEEEGEAPWAAKPSGGGGRSRPRVRRDEPGRVG